MIQLRRHNLPLMLRSAPRICSLLLLAAAAVLGAGCAATPSAPTAGRVTVEPRVADAAVGGAIADVAMGMVGTRYRYGGADPLQGFDCSGLVHYAYGQAGYDVPRTSRELFRAARKIAMGAADPGDLMFFQDQAKLSHVGIYVGDGLFVHAPASGQNVTVARLDSAYYQEHLVAVGRLLPR
jgi:cell wall-associated NlpC family hydrolase